MRFLLSLTSFFVLVLSHCPGYGVGVSAGIVGVNASVVVMGTVIGVDGGNVASSTSKVGKGKM